ncbi:MAG: hypothetical protein IJ368_03920 [Oscillospiraceae bacterium]|nr:hypothetical protein [Oscillospiraceae bacterium]
MYRLSELIAQIIANNSQGVSCRRNMLYLNGLAEEIKAGGVLSPAVIAAAENDNVFMTEQLIMDMIDQLGILEYFECSEISEELYYRVSVEEYKRGYFDSACDFLYFRKHITERLEFPYNIEYDPLKEYYAENKGEFVMCGAELEEFASEFLEKAIKKPAPKGTGF